MNQSNLACASNRGGFRKHQHTVCVKWPAHHLTRPTSRASLRPAAASTTSTDAAPAPKASDASSLKADVLRLAGSKYGHDLDEATKASLEAACQQLSSLGQDTPGLAPGSWRLVYSNSTGNSSGKLGPFITEVEQVFPADQPGTYYNISRLGLLSATLRGECTISPNQPNRVSLEFKDVALKLGQLQLAKKVWEPGQMRGHWSATYWDDSLRVFNTNKGSLFVMAKNQ